jgi:acetyl esterase/lipase
MYKVIMKNKFLFLIITALILCLNQSNAQEWTRVSKDLPEGVEIEKDIPYVNYQNRKLLLDIYRPSDATDKILPTIIAIRGGGWLKGDKEGYAHIAAALALRGFAAICIEYRTADEAKFPAAVLDTKSAVKWVKTNAGKYNLNPLAIGAIGGSAGAHLALLLGVSSNASFLNPTGTPDDFTIQAVVGLATPTYVKQTLNPGKTALKWMGQPYASNKELWKSASPISHINKNSPPVLLIQSSTDDLVGMDEALSIIENLGKASVYSELVLIPDAPHAFWPYEEWFEFTMDKAAAFFHKQLRN